jgi:triosephosphate isomerase
MKKIIAANWKMNPESAKEAEGLAEFLVENYTEKNVQLILFPPFIYFCDLRDELEEDADKFDWGAQDIFWEEAGAFTGEISPTMLKSLWVRYVIVGHSERRWKLGETDEIINKKVKAALENEITPILAVGEKEKGDSVKQFLEDQLSRDLDGLSDKEVSKIIVAYEPVWAIGTGDADDPEDTVKAIGIIKDIIGKMVGREIADKIPVLYGGSVNSKNAEDFLSRKEINGALVGGASLDKEEFLKILNIVEKL